ncbi:DNA adenine methylase [Candidatus Woesearchaeota archaeon]|nr:DNA adenine methylase [Candidatus Woesearchaeota archaeon]
MKKGNKKVTTLFRYPGGKYYALRILEPFWQQIKHDEYREPFVGGGSVFFAKDKSKYNWLNDKDDELMNTYRIIANPETRRQLINLVQNEEASKDRHVSVKNIEPKNDLERAFKYFYLNRTSFSGKMRTPSWGYRPKRSLPPNRWSERINPCGEMLKSVKLTSFDFEEIINSPKQGNSVLMFIDPPYFAANQESHYIHPFKKEDHVRLADCLKKTKHKFFLTYDDTPEIRKLYKWAYICPIQFYYRLDNSQMSNGSRKKGFELVITNYKVKTEVQAKLFSQEETTVSPPIKSPFRFPGSKAQAIKFIKPFWEQIRHTEFREPFFGGGAVFFAKPGVDVNWINDIDNELVITLKVMVDDTQRKKLIDRLSVEEATKDRHAQIKKYVPKDDLDVAFKYFYLNRTSYSGIMHKPAWGYQDAKSVPPKRWGKRIEEAAEKLKGTKITCLDFEKVITEPSNNLVFMFIDPPYYLADQKRAYKHHFTEEEHQRLARVLRQTKYPFCLTYDDCKPVRELYSWANLHPKSWRYHTANSNQAVRKMGNELIITNF